MPTGYHVDTSIASFGPAVLRLALAAVFIAHGGQKLFGLWGGPGLERTAAYFSQLGLQPAYPLAVAVGTIQFGGGLLLLLGAFTTLASVLLAAGTLGALWKVHYPGGFFLNWALVPGQAHGYEYHLVLLAGLVCLMFAGPGALSIDGRRASDAAARAAGRARIRLGRG